MILHTYEFEAARRARTALPLPEEDRVAWVTAPNQATARLLLDLERPETRWNFIRQRQDVGVGEARGHEDGVDLIWTGMTYTRFPKRTSWKHDSVKGTKRSITARQLAKREDL